MTDSPLTIDECVAVPARELAPGAVLLYGHRVHLVETGGHQLGESVRVTLEDGRSAVVGGGLRLLCDPATIVQPSGGVS